MKLVLVVSCAIFLANAVTAATYFVAQQATNAVDANAGTEAAPFKTIATAMARVQPGDTVYVLNGTYRESAVWTNRTWDAPMERITLAAYPGHRPVIKGSEIVTNRFTPVRVALRPKPAGQVKEAEYDPDAWRKRMGIDGPREAQIPPAAAMASNMLDNTHAPFVGIYTCPLENYAQMVFVDERPLKQVGLQGNPDRAENGGGFRFRRQWDGMDAADMAPGTFYYDAPTKKLYVWLRDGDDPSRHVVETSVRALGIIAYGVWTVSGFDVMHCMDLSSKGHGALVVMGHDSIVENCRILHNEFMGLVVQGNDCVIRGNEIAYNGLNGLGSSFGLRILVENNEFHDNVWRGDVNCCGGGNKVHQWHESRFIRNWFHDEPVGPALWLDINGNDALIAENRFDNSSIGIYFEISRWGVIVNNVVRNCAVGLWSYSSDVLMAHNVIEGCGEGIRLSGSARSCNYNQCVYLFEQDKAALMAVRNNLIVNNLVIDCPGNFIGATPDDPYGWANTIDYNAFVWTMPAIHPTGAHIKFMGNFDSYYGRLPTWRMARHYDEHSVIADPTLLHRLIESNYEWSGMGPADVVGDPRLADPANGNYTLLPDSPLRGKGIAIPDVLDSICPPTPYFNAIPRAWAMTFVEDAPATNAPAVTTVWGRSSYRLQPLPKIRRLVDLDAQEPSDPGPNPLWQRTGKYPRFKAEGEPDAVPDTAYAVYPDNRLADPSFDLPLAAPDKPLGEEPAGKWFAGGGMHTYSGFACMNLMPWNQTEAIAYQKVGAIRPDTEYVFVGDMRAGSADPRFEATASMALAAGGSATLTAGKELKPIKRIESQAAPGQTRHWNTHELYYRSGADSNADANVGRDLYVVIGSKVKGPADAKVKELAGIGRWDNFFLLTSAKPE